MCSAFTPDCGDDKSLLLFSLGTCIVPIQSVQVKVPLSKTLFNLSAEAFQERNILVEDQKNSIFYRLVKGFTFLKRTQNQFKMLLEMSNVTAGIVSTEGNLNLLTVM